MKSIIFLLLLVFITKSVFTQAPSKQEIQNQMGRAVKVLNQKIAELQNQIDEAINNKESAEVIKQKKDALALMKQQVAALSGSTKKFVNTDLHPIWQTAEKEDLVVPK